MDLTPDSPSTIATPPSRWALATQGDPGALRELAGSYWYCAYVWWRRAGLDAEAAGTATVASFTCWITARLPRMEDSGAGVMREWLPPRLAELAAEGWELDGEPAIVIEPEWAEGRYADEPEGEPDTVFHRRWTLTVLEFTMQALRAEYAARGLETLFAEVSPFVGFEGADEAQAHYAAAAERAGMTTGALKREVFDFRTHHREVLRSIVADTVADPADINSEITALLCACELPGAAAPLPTAIRTFKPDELLARAMNTVHMTSGGLGKWKPASNEEIARLFPQYETLGLIGRGGMGAVYRARQVALDREVAIKLLPLEVSADKAFADRFVREARAMAKLSHPNIISVFDFGTTGEGHLFFVMEYVEGANVSQIIRGPGLGPDQAVAIAGQVCTALAYAHGKGVVHRDIKPANVMVSTDGTAKVADFGLARVAGADPADFGQTVTGTIMGTAEYMSPEQKRGMAVDHRADIYSVGVMLYEMLCKEPPQGAFEPPSQRAGCDARLDQIVLKAMHRMPEGRYQSTTEMKLDLEAAGTPLPAAPQRRLPPPRGNAGVNRIPLAPPPKESHTGLIFTVIIVALVAGALYLLNRQEPRPDKPVAHAPKASAPVLVSPSDSAFIGPPVPAIAEKSEVMPDAVLPAQPLTGPKDLLAGVDVARDAVHGQWQMTSEGLSVSKNGNTDPGRSELLGFNYVPPEEYDFEIEFTIQDGVREISQTLPFAGRTILWKMGCLLDELTFFHFGSQLDGKSPTAKERTEAVVRLPRLEPNQRYRSMVEVRRGSLRALLDGQEVLRWSGDFQRLAGDGNLQLPNPQQLGVAAWNTGVLFHKAEVRPPAIANLAAVPRSAPGWTDLLAGVDLKRDVLSGDWRMENGELVSREDETTHRTLELPVAKVPGNYDLRYRLTRRKPGAAVYFAARSGNMGGALMFDGWVGLERQTGAVFVGDDSLAEGARVVQPEPFFDVMGRHELLMQVREDRVTASLDGKKLLNRKVGLARLNQIDGSFLRAGQRPGPIFAVGVCGGEVVFHSIEMKAEDPPMVAAAPALSALVAASNDPRLVKLEAAFKARFDSDAQKPYLALAAALNQSYLANGVARLRVAAQAQGSLDEVTALDAEKAAIGRGEGVPANDDAGTPEALKIFRTSYRMAMAKYNADRAKTAGQLYDMYLASLDGYMAELTRANKIDDAKKIKALREEVAAKKAEATRVAGAELPKAGSTAAPRTPDPAAPTGNPAGGGNAQSAAKWIVANGGSCQIAKGTLETEVETEKEIPVGKFEIRGLFLIRRPASRPPLADGDFQVLRGIKTLRAVSLRAQKVGDAAFTFLADSPDLASINLDEMSELTDGVLPPLAGAKKLTAFVLTGAKNFTGKGLDKMRWLPALTTADFLGCGVGDDGLKALLAAPKLRTLRLSSASGTVTDAGLAALANHPSLYDLNLDLCTGLTDAGFAALRGLKTLGVLGASGTGFGDAAAAAFANHPGLRQLNLSNTPLTDAGLAKLAALTKLQTLNVRDSKVTRAGVEAFKKAVPKCLVMQ